MALEADEPAVEGLGVATSLAIFADAEQGHAARRLGSASDVGVILRSS